MSRCIAALAFALATLSLAKTADAQVVQLPTFNFFATSGTVLVPDSGQALIGGVTRNSSGANQFGGPWGPGQRGIGSQLQGGGVSVTAQIHDLEAMDEAVLAEAAARRARLGLAPPLIARQEAPAASPATPAVMSLNEIAQRREAEAAAQDREAADFFARGREAQAAGKTNVARIYYQMAARRARGDFQQQILAQANALGIPAKSPGRVAATPAAGRE